MSPEYKQILTGILEKEKIASNASVNNLKKFIFASPCDLSGREYSIYPCLNPMKDLKPGKYLFFSVRLKNALSAFFDIIEKLPTCFMFWRFASFLKTE